MDLYNLSQEIPTKFIGTSSDGLDLEFFVHKVKCCLDAFNKKGLTDDFIAYIQYWPVMDAVKRLHERMYNYCKWFKSMPNDFSFQTEEDYSAFQEDYFENYLYPFCVELYYTFCRWREIIAKYMPSIVETTTGSTEEETQSDSTEDETQTDSEPNNATASTARKGRPVEPFEAILYGDDEQKLRTRKRLHEVMKGKSGKKAMVFIVAAVELGLIANPTYTQLKNEFGEGIGSQPNCDNFKNSPRQLRRDEIEGAKKLLER